MQQLTCTANLTILAALRQPAEKITGIGQDIILNLLKPETKNYRYV
jgi:hypothetical protein